MKPIRKLSLFIIGALVVAGSFAACSFRGDPEHRAEWMLDKVTKELELDDAQQAQLKSVGDEMMAARKAMQLQFGDDREQLLALFEQPTLDQDRILAVIRSGTEALNERAPEVVAAMGEFYDGLTAEQQVEIRDFIQEHRGRGGRWGQGHHD